MPEVVPTSPAYDEVPRRSLADLLEAQVVEVEAAALDLLRDPVGTVHDARVTIRKLRSTLAVHAPLLVPEAAKPMRRELAWLAAQLGPARDAQVMLARIREAAAELGSGASADALIAHFAEEESRAFAVAREALGSERFAAFVSRLDVARLRTLAARESAELEQVAAELTRLVGRLETSGTATDTQLHDLRKAVKRARYVRGANDEVDVALKRLQGVLGEHQDSVVARERLAELPASELVELLMAREHAAAATSQKRLRKAIRRLERAMAGASAGYT